MKLNNISLEKLRVKYGNATIKKIKSLASSETEEKNLKNNNGFWIKIRDNGDKVYFDGIKAFEISKSLNISMADNIFNVNLATLQRLREKTVDTIYKVRDSMKNYFPIVLNNISLNIAESTYPIYKDRKENIINNREHVKKIIINIKNEIKNNDLEKYFNLEELNEKNIINYFDKYLDLKDNKYKKYTITIKNIKCDTYLKDITKIEEIFWRNSVLTNNYIWNKTCGLKRPTTNITILEKTINNYLEYNEFEISVKNAINSYCKNTGFRGLEKKYQHQFMISEKTLNKFALGEELYRFEEEYYTKENEDAENDTGRIDCIFIGKKTNTIYLIELKVNEGVVGGPNGVQKHLIDIEKMLNDNKDTFIDLLEYRYNYRRSNLELDYQDVKLNRNKIYFITIIAFSEEKNIEHKKLVEELIINLNNEKYVISHSGKDEKESKQKNLLPPNSKIINYYINELKNVNAINCECIFLFDNIWNKKDIDENKLTSEIKYE